MKIEVKLSPPRVLRHLWATPKASQNKPSRPHVPSWAIFLSEGFRGSVRAIPSEEPAPLVLKRRMGVRGSTQGPFLGGQIPPELTSDRPACRKLRQLHSGVAKALAIYRIDKNPKSRELEKNRKILYCLPIFGLFFPFSCRLFFSFFSGFRGFSIL